MERILTIPLRAELLKAGREYKATRAVRTVRRFAAKHLKTEILVSPLLNEFLWAQSRERPPTTVRVKVIDGKAYLPDEATTLKVEEKSKLESLKEMVGGKKTEAHLEKSGTGEKNALIKEKKAGLPEEKVELAKKEEGKKVPPAALTGTND